MAELDFDFLAQQALNAPQEALTPQTNVVPFPQKSGTDFENLAGQVMKMQSDMAVQNLSTAQNVDPNKAAQALSLSKVNGVSPLAIEENLPQYQQSVQLTKDVTTLNQNPNLSQFIANNPLAARIAQDDFDKLGFIEKTVVALKTGISGAVLQGQMGRIGFEKQTGELFGKDTSQWDNQAAALNAEVNKIPQLSGGMGFVQKFTGFVTGLIDNAVQGAIPGAVIGGAGGSAFAGVGAIPGAAGGAVIGFNADMARVAAGNSYLKLSQMRGTDGQPISETGKQFGAIFTGMATYAIGAYGGKLIGQSADRLAQQAVEEALTRPTVTAALSNFAKETAKGAGQGAAIMTAMEGSAIIGEELAKQVSEGQFTTNPDEIINRLTDAAINGAVLLGTLHAGGSSLGLVGNYRAASRADAQMQMFKNLQEGAVASKLRERDLDAFQNFMQHQTEGSPVENIYIPAEKIREFYQQNKIIPSEDRAQDSLFGFVKDMPEQLREAETTGGDIVIPTADYVTHLAGTPISERLLPDIRVGENAMSVNEAKAFQAEYQTRIKVATEEAAKPQELTSFDKISQDVTRQAIEAGYSPTLAEKYGAIAATRSATRGERLGIDPLEAYRQNKLIIQKGEQVTAQPIIPQKEARPANAEILRQFVNEAGWEQTGGRLIRDTEGKAISRTTWIPRAPWWPEFKRQSNIKLSETQLNKAVEKSIAGQTLSPRETRAIKWLLALDEHYREKQDEAVNLTREAGIADWKPTLSTDDFSMAEKFVGSELSGKELAIADLTAKAVRIDESAVEKLATQDLSDDVYAAQLQEIINRDVTKTETGTSEISTVGTASTKPTESAAIIPPRSTEQSNAASFVSREYRQSTIEGLPLFQKEDGETRGSIRFEQEQTIITLFKDKNPSTLIHEMSHMWLEELIGDAKRTDAPQQLKDDLAATLKWMGITDPSEIATAHHEQFARAGEAYLMEGKAPSTALAGIFSRFKAWLTRIYQTVANLDTPINTEIRGVFDRLLATDSEIASAKKSQALEPAFKSKEEAGMTSAEWNAYLKNIDRANQQAESQLLDKMMAKVRRQRTAEYKSESAPLREEVTRDIDKRQDVQALQLLTKGIMPDGSKTESIKLQREVMDKLYDKKELSDLPRGVIADTGVHPDHVAEILGFSSGDEMIRSLQSLEQQQREVRLQEGEKRGIRQYLIDQAIAERIGAKHGDIMDEASIKEEAIAAIHNEKQDELLATELRYLKRMGTQALIERGQGRKNVEAEKTKADQKIGDLEMTARWNQAEADLIQQGLKEAVNVTRAMLEGIRTHVETILDNKKIDEIGRYSKYLRDERKAAREVQEAILKKDWNTAAAAKQRQLLANILYSKGKEASEIIDKANNLFDRLASKSKFDGISQEYTDQIHGLLERFGIRTVRDADELNRGIGNKTLADFAEDKFASGYELPMSPVLAQGGGDAKSMKFVDFKDFTNLVRSLQNAGRQEQVIKIGDQIIDKEIAVFRLVETLGKLKQKEKSDYLKPEDQGKFNAEKEKSFSWLRSLNAALLKIEQLFDWFDADKSNGPFNQMIFRPLKEAAHWENERRAEMVTTLRSIQKEMPKRWEKHLNDSVESNLPNSETGNPYKMTRKRMLSIALNWGTEDNATKLSDGYRWDSRSIQSFLDKNMKKEDWRFVQLMWASFDKYRTEIDDLQRYVTGVGIEFVEGRSIQTPFGSIEGKYFPLVYDATKSIAAEKNAERTRDALFENQYPRVTTHNGSVISRVEGVKQPIELSLDIIPWKISQTIHDLAFRKALMQADKLLSDRRVVKAMDDSMGSEYRKLLRPWLQHIANVSNINDTAMSWGDKFLNAARTNITMVGIGFRATTMLKHGFTALSNSVGELGSKWMGVGLKEMFGTPQQMKRTWNMAMEMSDELKFRRDRYDRDVAGNLQGMLDESKFSKLNRGLQEYGTLGVATLDIMSAVPTWLGAFRKAQSEGMVEKDAIYYADKMVRKAHGAQGITDTAAFQNSKSQIYRLTGMFYGFFNHIYNRQADTLRKASMIPEKIGQGDFKGAGNDFAQVLARSIYYLIIPGIAEALWTHGGPDDKKDENWFEWATKATLAEIPAGIPILRDIAKAAIDGHEYEVSPLARAINTIVGTSKDIGALIGLNEKEPSKRALQHAIESFGYFTGTPSGQAGAIAQFLWDVGQGNQDPQQLSDWIQGLMHGKFKQE